jgi:hypothetical protein
MSESCLQTMPIKPSYLYMHIYLCIIRDDCEYLYKNAKPDVYMHAYEQTCLNDQYL